MLDYLQALQLKYALKKKQQQKTLYFLWNDLFFINFPD